MEKQNLRVDAVEEIFKVQWIPEWGQERIANMIENRPDWCISRQRLWGTPIPLFVHKETNELHPETLTLMDKAAELVEQGGIEAWFNLEAKELLGEQAKQYRKITDTLDVWFDSGVTHACVLATNADLAFPADLYLEGSDQHRGWFHSSLLSSVAMQGTAPYRQVLTHGYTVDAKGHKMSKSLGNVIAPEKVINNLGADILRLWVASVDYRSEIAVSDEILKRASDAYRRIRNTTRFLLSNLFDFEPAKHLVADETLLTLDKTIIEQAKALQVEIQQAYDDYQFHLVYQKVHHFCAIELGSFYLDIIKDRQYTTKTESLARRSCQTAMYHIVEALVRWLAPILSFTAEEIWQCLPGERESSVFLTAWYQGFAGIKSDAVMNQEFWQRVMQVRDAVNKEIETQRAADKIGSALEAEVTLYCEPDLKLMLDNLQDELRFALITSTAKVKVTNDKPDDAVATELLDLFVEVAPSEQTKCARCWHRRADVGSDAEHPELCARCVINVTGEGEQRLYA